MKAPWLTPWQKVLFNTAERGWSGAFSYETEGTTALPYLRALKAFDELRRTAKKSPYLFADALEDTGSPHEDASCVIVRSADVDWDGFP